MTRNEIKAFVTRLIAAWNDHDVTALTAFYDRDAIVVSTYFGELRGREAIEQSYRKFFVEWPDVSLHIDAQGMLIDGSRLAVFAQARFTNSFPIFGIAPSGETIDLRTVVVVIVLDGEKIIHEQRMWDARSLHGVLEKLVLDRELHSAAEVQRALLPRHRVAREYCDVAGASIPCRTIGGDFFEHIELPSGAIGVALGDVSGKGPPAALLTSMIQGIFAAEVEAGCGPAEMMARINRLLLKRGLEARFATFFYGVLTSDGRFTYANAGHNPPIVLRRHTSRSLTAGGTILGMFGDASFVEDSIQLEPGDTVVCFTDGVTEARNVAGEEFGEDRLLVALNGVPKSVSCEDAIARTFNAIRDFCGETAQHDDITILMLRFVDRDATH